MNSQEYTRQVINSERLVLIIRRLVIVIVLLLLLGWRLLIDVGGRLEASGHNLDSAMWHLTWWQEPARPLVDNITLYEDDVGTPIVFDFYLTVLPPANAEPDAKAYASLTPFAQMNQITDYRDEKPLLPAQLVIGTESGATLNTITPLAATITLRGHSSLTADRKSYKLMLTDSGATWQGQVKINLNKHPNDESRMRNRVAYELFRSVPGLVSMRTSYVRLYVRDLSGSDDITGGLSSIDSNRAAVNRSAAISRNSIAAAGYVDYGLFTQIEQADSDFLKTHGLDEHGNLYKAESFEFLRYEEVLKNIDDPSYDEEAFEQRLEIRAGDSHDDLLLMLDDVNNYDLDINKVFDRWFNRENYFTWLAVNILLGNFDTQTQNYFLYSPHDSKTWYFLPWDYDGSMVRRDMTDPDGQPAQLIGAANYWGCVLHRRMLSDPDNLKQLSRRIDEVRLILNRDLLSVTIERHRPVIEKYYLEDPYFYRDFTAEEFYDNLICMTESVEHNYQLYYDNLERPMPFFLGASEISQNDGVSSELLLRWGESRDLQNDQLTYTLQIARDLLFEDLVVVREGLRQTEYMVSLADGTYYWRVIAVDSNGNYQRAFDIYWPEGAAHNIHTGVYGVAGLRIGGDTGE
jgi:spore coat protein H